MKLRKQLQDQLKMDLLVFYLEAKVEEIPCTIYLPDRSQIWYYGFMNKFTLELLAVIADLGEGLENFVTTPYGKLRIHSIPRSTYYNALGRLERKKFIVKHKIGRKNKYQLTEKGKAILKGPLKRNRRTDGNVTIIVFDIPEENSKQRAILRRYLKKEGYTMLQKSVFISPFEISEDLKDLIAELKIRQHVSAISGKMIYNF